MKCFDYIDGHYTSGLPIWRRKCFCGTTGCLEIVRKKTETMGELFDRLTEENYQETVAISKVISSSL